MFSKIMCAVIVLAMLFGCGGGSSSDGGSSPQTDPPSANGIWQGTFTEDGTTYDLKVLTYGGDFIGISEEAGVIYKGTYQTSRNNISGSVDAWAIGGTLFATGTITGTFSEQDVMTVTVAASTGTSSSVNVLFDELYNRASSYSLIEGSWGFDDGAVNGTIVVDAQGGISGSDSVGCVYTGVASILDPDHNMYALDFDVTGCGVLDGQYDGLGILQDDISANETLVYCISSNDWIVLSYLTRQ